MLALFAAGAYWMIRREALNRMDQRLGEQARRLLFIPEDARTPRWDLVVRAQRAIQRDESWRSFILMVKDGAGKTIYQSSNWPRELSETLLPPAVSKSSNDAAPPAPPRRPPPALPRKALLLARPDSVSSTECFTHSAGRRAWRMAVTRSESETVIIGVDLAPFQAEIHAVRRAFLIALPAALVLIAAGAAVLSHRSLRPVRRLARTIEAVTAGGLDQRIPVRRGDPDFEGLIQLFNRMMDRLEHSFQQASRFSADAAHELKTPLTILQGRLEQAIQDAGAGSQAQQDLTELLEEAHRLRSIVEKLLILSRADAGRLELSREEVDLSRLVEDICEDTTFQAPELTFERQIEPGIHANVDRELVTLAVRNLASNAVKYNTPGGRVRFTLMRAEGRIELAVSNTGPGIAEEDRGRLFERFHRGDKSRSRRIEGAGLGLSLARAIARAHSGDVVLAPASEGGANDGLTRFLLTLPA